MTFGKLISQPFPPLSLSLFLLPIFFSTLLLRAAPHYLNTWWTGIVQSLSMGHTRWDTGLKVDCCRVWQKSKINHVYRVPCNFLCISIWHHFLKEPPLPTSVKRLSHNPLRNGRFLIQVNKESHKGHIKDLPYVNRISTSPVLSLVWQRTHSNFQPQKWTTCELLCAECLKGLLTEKSSLLSGKPTE